MRLREVFGRKDVPKPGEEEYDSEKNFEKSWLIDIQTHQADIMPLKFLRFDAEVRKWFQYLKESGFCDVQKIGSPLHGFPSLLWDSSNRLQEFTICILWEQAFD